ncbi:MAG TPA: PIG-L family deacetylase [Thermomicrobiales bacterium]|nr:PIG-L family deacetylase [Thermomicrobiales bacterium]
MHVVSIMAHQDDEMRCLGTMLKCRARGDSLAFITVTDGSKGFVQDPLIGRAAAAEIRANEMRLLADEIEATLILIGEPDEFLYDTEPVRMKLIEAIRATRADLIFTHYHEDYNLDHTTVCSLVRQCAMHACLPVLQTDSPPLTAHPAVFMVEPHGPVTFPASHYVDMSAYQEQKLRLLANHASQDEALEKGTGSALATMTSRLSAYRGEQVGCAHAEAFTPMRARGALKPFSVLP